MVKKSKQIAIIGMACRFPGANNYRDFWKNLVNGVDSVVEVPKSRWDWSSIYGDPAKESNKTNIKYGGFIEYVDKFDPLFFGISPKEANLMDPQHRLILQNAWRAIEDAGYNPESLSGEKIGVYVGVSKNDYAELMREDHTDIGSFVSTGTVHSILANRISYLLNFRGPSESVDTACSSALVAMNHALTDIRLGKCHSAIVGGVNLMLSPTMFISHSKSGFLAKDGRCRSFDKDAQGYVRSEGVGVIYVKDAELARKDGDAIWGFINGVGVTHNGRTSFLTSPDSNGQAETIRAALNDAGATPDDISYIEAHGTGTALGDPVEFNGLASGYSERNNESPIYIGSVKSNIGHLEAAAGIAGVIKTVLCMKFKELPKLIHLKNLNPLVKNDQKVFDFLSENQQWKLPSENNNQSLMAGVSSFGMGGVNAHVILEEGVYRAPVSADTQPLNEHAGNQLFILSAKKGSLVDDVKGFLAYLDDGGRNDNHLDMFYTLQIGRKSFDDKLAIVGDSIAKIEEKLKQFVTCNGGPVDGILRINDVDEEKVSSYSSQDLSAKAHQLACQWLSGDSIDWGSLYQDQPRLRLHLSKYIFAKHRCWYKDESEDTSPKNTAEKFVSIELNSDHYLLTDHKIGAQKSLPGVATFEFLRKAVNSTFNTQIIAFKDLYWISSIQVNNDNKKLRCKLEKTDHLISFRLTLDDVEVVKGVAITGEFKESYPYSAFGLIQNSNKIQMSKDDIYTSLKDSGMDYGPMFQVIDILRQKSLTSIVSKLRFQGSDIKDMFDSTICDGVFQTIIECMNQDSEFKGVQYVPYFLKHVEFYAPITTHCFAVVDWVSKNRRMVQFDMVLLDNQGKVLAKFDGFGKRLWEQQPKKIVSKKSTNDANYFWYQLRNQLIKLNEKNEGSTILVDTVQYIKPSGSGVSLIDKIDIHNVQDIIDQLVTFVPNKHSSLSVAIVAPSGDINSLYSWLLSLIQTLMKSKICKQLSLAVLCHKTIDNTNPTGFSLGGFAKTLAYENPSIRLTIVDADLTNKKTQQVILQSGDIFQHHWGNYLRIYDDRVHALKMTSLNYLLTDKSSMLKKQGIYVISGGAGGIGYAISEHLIKHYQAHCIWLGRKKINHNIKQNIQLLTENGGQVTYHSVDITSKADIKSMLSNHDHLDGVIHAAGVIDDAFILRKTTESATPVLKTKIHGLQNLDECTKDYKIDFICCLSSIAAWIPNQGQSDYATANRWMDGFMQQRRVNVEKNRRFGVSLSLNLPLWNAGGIGVNQQEEAHLEKEFGMVALTNDDGVKVFCSALNFAKDDNVTQLFVIHGNKQKIDAHLDIEGASQLNKAKALANETTESEKSDSLISDTASVQFESSETLASESTLSTPIEFKKKFKDVFATIFETQVSKINDQDFISDYGLDSVKIPVLMASLHDSFGVKVPETVIFEVKTVDDFAMYLETNFKTLASRSEVTQAEPSETYSLVDINESNIPDYKFKKVFSNEEFYQVDHVVDDQYNVPGAVYVEMGRQAVELIVGKQTQWVIKNNFWLEKLSSPGPAIHSYIDVKKKASGAYHFEVSSKQSGAKKLHAIGDVFFDTQVSMAVKTIDIEKLKNDMTTHWSPTEIYESIHSEGLIVGETFMPMQGIDMNRTQALGHMKLPESVTYTHAEYWLHPTLLTGIFQVPLILNKFISKDIQYIPIGIEEIIILDRMPKNSYVLATFGGAKEGQDEVKKFTVQLLDESGRVVILLNGFTIRALKKESPTTSVLNSEAKNKVNTSKSVASDDNESNTAEIKLDLQSEPTKADIQQQMPQSKPNAESNDLIKPALIDQIKKWIAPVVGLGVEEISTTDAFETVGINSIMIVELNGVLDEHFADLSKTLFFEYLNCDELADYFIENHRDEIIKILNLDPNNLNTDQTESDVISDNNENNTAEIQLDLQSDPTSDHMHQKMPQSKPNAESNDLIKLALIDQIKNWIAPVVGLGVEEISTLDAFETVGINSIMIVELNGVLDEHFEDLSKTLFFEYLNCDELADYFIENHRDEIIKILNLDPNNLNTDQIESDVISDNMAQSELNAANNNIVESELGVTKYNIGESELTITNENNTAEIQLDFQSESTNAYMQQKMSQSKPTAESKLAVQDIAIIGLGGRYPKAKSLDAFWENLKAGRDCIEEIPENRFNIAPFYNPDKSKKQLYAKWGSFIDDIDMFDPLFFGISPKEAELMDPQERLFLQTVYETIEDAGYIAEALNKDNQKVGVYVGALWQPYSNISAAAASQGQMLGTSGLLYSIANRISYYFNFKGPSMAIDTACSSSLSALHLACQSIKAGEIDAAIVGGVNVSMDMSKYSFLSEYQFLSEDGRCRSFGEGGTGYVPGEGIGAMLIKPKTKAIKDGDDIYGVIKSTGLNHGGKVNGYTVPNPKQQGQLIADVIKYSNVNVRNFDYIEAHGTGTSLGDPIEITGLSKAFGEHTKDTQFCAIGSVKSNIGHLEAAAGIAGLTKILLQMKHGYLVPSIHSDTLNSNINFEKTPFYVQRTGQEWVKKVNNNVVQPWLSGLSSFGAGGSNAHVIIESFVKSSVVFKAADSQLPVLPWLLISAQSEDKLKEIEKKINSYIDKYEPNNEDLNNICYTLQVGRHPMPYRLAIDTSDLSKVKRGVVKDSSSVLEMAFDNPAEKVARLQTWIANNQYQKIVDLWLEGLDINWMDIYAKGFYNRHHGLPSIQFDEERYPIPKVNQISNLLTNQTFHNEDLTYFQQTWLPMILKNESISQMENTLLITTNKDLLSTIESKWPTAATMVLSEGNKQVYDPHQLYMLFDGLRGLIKSNKFKLTHIILMIRPTERLLSAALIGLLKTCLTEGLIKKSIHIEFESVNDQGLSQVLNHSINYDPATFQSYRLTESDCLKADVNQIRSIPQEQLDCYPASGDTVLITGGLGDIGMMMVKHLSKTIDDLDFILCGRSQLDESKQQKLEHLIAYGANVTYVPVDISKQDDVAAALAPWLKNQSINGVIHAAGVIRDSLMMGKTETDFIDVVRSKWMGCKIVSDVVANQPLRFFCVFSSVTALFGNKGQSDYALANALCDAFIFERQLLVSKGECYGYSLSINWPLWESGAMGQNDYVKTMVKNSWGLNPLKTEHAMKAFDAILISGLHQVLPAVGDVNIIDSVYRFMPKSESSKMQQEDELSTDNENDLSDKKIDSVNTEEQNKDVADLNSTNIIEQTVKEFIVNILKIKVEKLKLDVPLTNYGFDSIGLSDFAQKINDAYSLDTEAGLFFDVDTIEKVVAFICENSTDFEMDTIKESSEKIIDSHDHVSELENEPKKDDVKFESDLSESNNMNADELNTDELNSDVTDSNLTHVIEEADSMHIDSDYSKKNKQQAVAVIGMHCRFPGADGLDEYWQMIEKNQPQYSNPPKGRFKGLSKKEMSSYYSGFINDVDKFDATLFGISNDEACMMDPQHRLLLESAYKTIENSGYSLAQLQNSRVGVFVGIGSADYVQEIVTNNVTNTAFTSIGTTQNMAANRVSYHLKLTGPSEVVDTACSSSLVAIHRALRALDDGECDYAIVGGVQLLLSTFQYQNLNALGLLSKSKQTKSFDEQGDGYVRGEGVGTILLTHQTRSKKLRDYVYGLIKGSAVNHSGNNGISMIAPSKKAMADVMRAAYDSANVDVKYLTYIESHGTGTAFGDPAEIASFKNVVSQLPLSKEQTIGISTVKPLIGHLEAASGMASFIKCILALKHRKKPGLFGLEELNPSIRLKKSPLYMMSSIESMPTNSPCVASVHSYGYGGSNAHIVCEASKDSVAAPHFIPKSSMYELIAISAMSKKQLMARVNDLISFIPTSQINLTNLSYSLNQSGGLFDYRLAMVVSSIEDLMSKLHSINHRFDDLPAHCYQGKINTDIDDAIQQVSAIELNEDAMTTIAKQWLMGYSMDWSEWFLNRDVMKQPTVGIQLNKKSYWFDRLIDANTAKIKNKNSRDKKT